MNLLWVLELLYRNEINCGLSSFWDAGWEAWLGDKDNGIRAKADGLQDMPSIAQWLYDTAKEIYGLKA